MVRVAVCVVVSLALGLAGAVAILTDSYPHEGPYVSFSASHGIHVGDLIIVAAWSAVTAALLIWARRGLLRHR